YFPQILAMLPDDAARQSIIKSLTEPDNRLRVHQGVLLACLYDLNYPAGMDGRSWWLHHKEFFRAEHDPVAAASLTQGFLDNVGRIYPDGDIPDEVLRQCRAARYQQHGTWGGHFDFGVTYIEMERGDREPDAQSLESARDIVWWPERQKQTPPINPVD
ncbi:MAG: hypothetical protein KDA41_08055, partial [Planctomycetales bacterium]|nr:hypothetical protein [Planctomycetales bacterium]